jgi:hypothetical protein
LEDFKTVETYGEFWYPVPNVEFRDRTTFYEFIVGWLVGFEDKRGNWPAYHLEENLQWQGYINAEGQRLGWRAALKPSHDFIFTMPTKNHPYYSTAFTALIRGIFVRFTQEEGPIVAVTPHSFRHMLSSYLSNIDISSAEKLSFSYVLHHSVEMHQGSYVYQDNMSRITPAVKRMEQIIRDLIV